MSASVAFLKGRKSSRKADGQRPLTLSIISANHASRLANPRDMAAAVLGQTVEEVSAAIATGKTTGEALPSPVPVYVTYFTAWPNEDGTVEYFDDVYGRDVLALAAMKATSEQRTDSVSF